MLPPNTFPVSSSERNVSRGKIFTHKKYIHVYGLKIVSLPETIKTRNNKKFKINLSIKNVRKVIYSALKVIDNGV